VIHATSKNAPCVVDVQGSVIKDSGAVRAGYWVRLSLNLFAYNNKNVGVGCGLQNVLFVRADEGFGGGGDAAGDFSKFFEASASEFSAPSTESADEGMFA
jgi:hypothetical protein